MIIARETYCTNSLNMTSDKLKKKNNLLIKSENASLFNIGYSAHTHSVTGSVDEEVTLSTT